MEKNHKLGIIVPYRDRHDHLQIFKDKIVEYLESKNIDYYIIIIEQNAKKPFNRGKLLNIGFCYAKKLNCDYVVFHDVDMIPIDVDYSFSIKPLHLSNNFISENDNINKTLFDEYFGGVTMFPTDIFENINGYSNEYWGWGFEDDDLLFRCKIKNIELNSIYIENIGRTKNMIQLNGFNSYIKCNKTFNFNNDLTIFISFLPDNLIFDYKSDSDIFTIFSIPGYDFSISYTSFLRYSFVTFDLNKNVLYINSNIKPMYKTNIVITIDVKSECISMYQDGLFINKIENYKKLYNYDNEKYFFIGGNPDKKNYFSGYFDCLGIYSRCMSSDEIYEISTNNFFNVKKHLNDSLIVGYDTNYIKDYKLIDLSNNKNDGEIYNSNIEYVKIENNKKIKIPYRRDCKFLLLYHTENGFMNNKWKYKETRWNQLKFVNEVIKDPKLIENDGLSNLSYIEHKIDIKNNIIQILVEL